MGIPHLDLRRRYDGRGFENDFQMRYQNLILNFPTAAMSCDAPPPPPLLFFNPLPSMIGRVRVFIRMAKTTVSLFYFLLIAGTMFTLSSTNLFGSTSRDFSTLKLSYLTVNQYFIRPPAIYSRVSLNHPYLGPVFVFLLGFTVIFFVITFFIAFLSDSYSEIQNQVMR